MPYVETEYVFSGSLCRVREFTTDDGKRFCITIFSLYDYKYLHFPHEEYKYIARRLYALQVDRAIAHRVYDSLNEKNLRITHSPIGGEVEIKLGTMCLTIGPVTAFGIVKTMPFTDIDVFSVNKTSFTCDSKLDICTCKSCPAFKRLRDFESAALEQFGPRKLENVIFPEN